MRTWNLAPMTFIAMVGTSAHVHNHMKFCVVADDYHTYKLLVKYCLHVSNMATVRNFGSMSDIFNVDRLFT